MSIQMSATSSGSQLADNYDIVQYYHNDSSIIAVKHHHWMLTLSVYLCLLSVNWMWTLNIVGIDCSQSHAEPVGNAGVAVWVSPLVFV